jgi:hypothetical protein
MITLTVKGTRHQLDIEPALRHLSAHPRRDPPRRGADAGLRSGSMNANNATPAPARRQFIFAAPTATGGLAIGIGPARALPIAPRPWSPETADPHEFDTWPNAIFAATGKRIRRLSIRDTDLTGRT